MRANQLFNAAVLFLLLSTSCLAQGTGNACMPTGRWYGGSQDAKYHLTVNFSVTGYSVMFQGAYQADAVETKYTGEIVPKGDHYEGGIIQLCTTEAKFPAPLPYMIAAWGSWRLTDCNTLSITWTFAGTYSASSIWAATGAKVPFRDRLDDDWLAGTTLQETYRRVPTTCAVCPVVP
jgi:hypothetical protein